jgi:hypothetical protein
MSWRVRDWDWLPVLEGDWRFPYIWKSDACHFDGSLPFRERRVDQKVWVLPELPYILLAGVQ